MLVAIRPNSPDSGPAARSASTRSTRAVTDLVVELAAAS
jgi:hypothetical protein